MTKINTTTIKETCQALPAKFQEILESPTTKKVAAAALMTLGVACALIAGFSAATASFLALSHTFIAMTRLVNDVSILVPSLLLSAVSVGCFLAVDKMGELPTFIKEMMPK